MTTKTEPSPDSAAGSRAEAFKEEVKALKIKDPNASRDYMLQGIGLGVMLLGVVVSVVGYFLSHSTNNPGSLNDALTIAIVGVTVAVVGGALFLRFSFSVFLRFWLARFLFEQQRGRD